MVYLLSTKISPARPPRGYQRKIIFVIAGLQIQFLESSSSKTIKLETHPLRSRILNRLLYYLVQWIMPKLTIIFFIKINSKLYINFVEKEMDHLPKGRKIKPYSLPVTAGHHMESLPRMTTILP